MKMSKILIRSIISLGLAASFIGCNGANVHGQMRSSFENSKMETRCVRVDMRNDAQMDEVFKRFDGWRVFYISEYTTENRFGTDGSVCFERPN